MKFAGLLLIGGAACCLSRPACAAPLPNAGSPTMANSSVMQATAARIINQREGDVTRFLVENKECCEVTVTFDLSLVNLKSDVAFPYTATFAPGQTTEAFALSPVQPDAKWTYDYWSAYKLGSQCCHHDDTHVYALPYPAGSAFKVSQGYETSFTHNGSGRFAIDWEMPEGTPVLAARGGIVVKVKDDSARGGPSMCKDCYNNFVLIRHDDGTLGQYCHLQKGGCCVKPGQQVAVGEMIGRSGNTGFSTGPHLHFAVFKTRDGRERETLPVKFRTAEEPDATLVQGRSYQAPSQQQAAAPPGSTPIPSTLAAAR